MEIAVVDDNKTLANAIAKALKREQFDAKAFYSADDALNLIDTNEMPDLFILDYKLKTKTAMEMVDKIIRGGSGVIIITAYGEVDISIEAFKKGVYDFLIKPLNMEHLIFTVYRFFKELEKKEIDQLQDEKEPKKLIQGRSKLFEDLMENADKVAESDTTVLILGESGTGKEVLAKYVHKKSPRGKGPFIPVNCASIPENLLESELFGYERGAFTGAYKRKRGFMELAQDGTLFLDEIGDMPLSLQAKLLRVLQDGVVYRLGSEEPIQSNFRLITSTNKDLEKMVKEGTFREDLFYRISVFPLRIPSLAKRPEDIPYIADYYVDYYGRKIKHKSYDINDEAKKKLMKYSWPGNIRELENILERAVIVSSTTTIKPEDILLPLVSENISLIEIGEQAQKEAEIEYIKKALAICSGDKKCAANKLQINYRTLLNKMKEYGLS